MTISRRAVLAWAPYLVLAVPRVVLVAIGDAAAGPTKVLLMPPPAVPVLALAAVPPGRCSRLVRARGDGPMIDTAMRRIGQSH